MYVLDCDISLTECVNDLTASVIIILVIILVVQHFLSSLLLIPNSGVIFIVSKCTSCVSFHKEVSTRVCSVFVCLLVR